MPFTLTTTGSTANSYADVAFADAYFEGRLECAWAELDSLRKEQALFTAMRLLSGLPWSGEQQTPTQPLDWPRIACRPNERSAPQVNGYYQNNYAGAGLYDQRGRWWAVTDYPAPVKQAQCEIALAMLADASLNDATVRKTTLSGAVSMDNRAPAGTLPPMAAELLRGFLLPAQVRRA